MRQTQAASFFLQAMSEMKYELDGAEFHRRDIEALKEAAQAGRAAAKAGKLGLKHLEVAFTVDVFPHDWPRLRLVKANAKALEKQDRERRRGQWVPFERGGGYRIV